MQGEIRNAFIGSMKLLTVIMKNLFLFSLIILVHSTICQAQSNEDFMLQSVSFENLSIRSISKSNYVREITVRIFTKELHFDEVVFNEELFTDNGERNDLVAGDSIFTSVNIFEHNDSVLFKELNRSYGIANYVFINKDFKYKNQLMNTKRANGPGGSIEIRGDICFCGCDRCNCLACKWWDGPGCWYFCDGKLSFDVKIDW